MKLIVVSNREPYRVETVRGRTKLEKTVGGLVSALEPVLRKEGGVWVCWGRKGQKTPLEVKVTSNFLIKHVPLTSADVSEYYYGFANDTLWPLCHMFINRTHFNNRYWLGYSRVNRKFAKAVSEIYSPGYKVLVNDYQLALVPKLLKEQGIKDTIYMFWHIPFPPYFILRFLPQRRELLEGMLGADVIGFHTQHYVQNFQECVREVLGAFYDDNAIYWNGRKIKVKAVPVGIDVNKWEKLTEEPKVVKYAQNLRRKLGVEYVGIGVDRLDYTKGLEEKFKGIGRFFEKYPSFRGKVSFIQIAAPTRTRLEEYMDIKRKTDEIVGMIEGRFGEPGWVPIYYYYKNYGDDRLASFYMIADFALVTPVIDGLNLVSKEYVVSRKREDGVLILSEFAGASVQLRNGAIIVNPFDEEALAESIYIALKMKKREKRERMKALREKVIKEDIHWWLKNFLEDVPA
ncbi:trehalose 6-phosphate synthase [Hydrogenivirga caldilitoris]|uniref:Trehalose 6-phosphate synthase n=1 Tax=Hydrogenivirga caldilitoris TaxID=246264 RepID=A0A497XPS4_9AQUI|nr:trehalose-6-phosphate synthase [Hydrogenivirga caldilitoris]RLJ70271.1 trehalose 6-phosphate synthase [Hydrogenivirga caldilitoris]